MNAIRPSNRASRVWAYTRWRTCLPGSSPGCAFPENTICTGRSEEHTSELQSQSNLVCRLLLEKKKKLKPLVVPQGVERAMSVDVLSALLVVTSGTVVLETRAG